MTRFLTAMIATVALAGCASSQTKTAGNTPDTASRVPASSSSDVSLSGKKAADMMALMEKVDAIIPDSSDCGAGTCGEEGEIAISCKYPNGPNPGHRMNCDVSSVANSKKSVSLSGLKARQLVGLMETLKAVEEEDDSCEMGSCYEQGKLHITCTYRNGPAGGNNRCEATAMKLQAHGKFPACSGDYDHGSCDEWQACCDKSYPGKKECVPGRCG